MNSQTIWEEVEKEFDENFPALGNCPGVKEQRAWLKEGWLMFGNLCDHDDYTFCDNRKQRLKSFLRSKIEEAEKAKDKLFQAALDNIYERHNIDKEEARKEGEKIGQAKMNNSGRLLYEDGRKVGYREGVEAVKLERKEWNQAMGYIGYERTQAYNTAVSDLEQLKSKLLPAQAVRQEAVIKQHEETYGNKSSC